MIGMLQKTWLEAKTFGVRNAVHGLAYRLLHRGCEYRVLKGMTITRVDPEFLGGNERYRYEFLKGDALLRFAGDPQYDMTPEFVAEALHKGDECFAILDGDVLASYGWYSNAPTLICEDLLLHFSKDYVYMYKGYTHPKYRGQRLHAIGMTQALQAYRERGFHGLISYVESNNYSSLKSVYRMGYVDIGRIYLARFFGRYRMLHTPGCRTYGFYLRQTQGRRIPVPVPLSDFVSQVPTRTADNCQAGV
jgi:ribosomal protein S18 acetylase RimI-like enzyme